MTSARFGIQYKHWSNRGLKDFVKERRIELLRDNRKHWIRRLRQKDRSATVDFFKFPPEIRNAIYKLLLSPQNLGEDGYPRACFPTILASCKQANDEAKDLVFDLYKEVSVPINIHLRDLTEAAGTESDGPRILGTKVFFNMRAVDQGRDESGNIKVNWPHALRKLRLLDINLKLDSIYNSSVSVTALHVAKTEFNHVLWDLYTFFKRQPSSSRRLTVRIRTELNTGIQSQVNLLSPVAGLASLVDDSNITGIISFIDRKIATELEQAMTELRGTRTITEEARLQNELVKALPVERRAIAHDDGSVLQFTHSYRELLAFYATIFPFWQFGHEYVYWNYGQVTDEIPHIGDVFDTVDIEELEQKLPHLNDKVEQLKRMREARKAKAAQTLSTLA